MHPPDEIISLLRQARRIFVTTHEKPDGDGLGATLGLCRLLKAANLSAAAVALSPVPRRYLSFIDSGEILAAPPAGAPEPGDLLVVLDSGTLDRTAPFAREWKGRVPVVNIDHHVSNDRFGDLNWVDDKASSAGELVHALARRAGWEIPFDAAVALWIAIVTDTGRFAYDSTSPAALQAAADLLRHPLPTADIDRRVYQSFLVRELKLQERAIAGLEVFEQGLVAVVGLAREDFLELGCGPEDAEDVVNIPRSVQGVQVSAFLYETEKRDPATGTARPVTKVSLRTSPPYDGAALCGTFGGGGHHRAAGCTIEARLPEARRQLLARIHETWFA